MFRCVVNNLFHGVTDGLRDAVNGVSNGLRGAVYGVAQGLLMVANGVTGGVMFLVTGVGDAMIGGVLQVVKFGAVLLIVHMMGMGIFYMWERNIQTSAHKIVSSTIQGNRISIGATSSQRNSSNNNDSKYPYVIEIPSKLSVDSLRNNRKSKVKERKSEPASAQRAEDSDAPGTDDEQ